MSDLSASELWRLKRFLSAHTKRFVLAVVRTPQGAIRDELAANLAAFAAAHQRTFQRLEPRQQGAVEIWRELESAVPPGGITMLDGLDAELLKPDGDLASLLNRQRERIAELLPGPVVLTLSEGPMNRFFVDAPDLADWYAASFEFKNAITPQVPARVDPQIPEPSAEWIESRIALLERQLSVNIRPHVRATVLRELADLYANSVFGVPSLPGRPVSRSPQQSLRSAEAALREAVEIERGLARDGAPQALLDSLEALGYLLGMMGRYAEAEPVCEEAVEIARREKGDEHPATLTALHNLAAVHGDRGDYATAEPLYKHLVATCERVLGPDAPDTLMEMESLANLYLNSGQLAEAEPLLRRTISANARLHGAAHPITLTSANSLAILYGKQGRYAEAEALLIDTLAARQAALGPEHPETLSSLNNLAHLYEIQGRYAEALPLSDGAATGAEKVLGPTHPKTVLYRQNLENLRAKMSAS